MASANEKQYRLYLRPGAKPRTSSGRTKDLTFRDGFFLRAQVESGKKYPMVVLIHGGPSSATTPEWPASFGMSRAIIAALSSRGYYVLLPNPRGSYGQGEEFTRANVKDFRRRRPARHSRRSRCRHRKISDRSCASGCDRLELRRLHDDVDGHANEPFPRRGSRCGHRQLAKLLRPEPDRPMDDPVLRFIGLRRSRRLSRRVRRLITSRRSRPPLWSSSANAMPNVPLPQSYEFWHALRTLGVPTQLVVHPGEGHLYLKPENQIDRLDRTVAWFDKYLK